MSADCQISLLADPVALPLGAAWQLHHGDCFDPRDGLRSLPAESVDLVITDPPYESLEKHRAVGTTTRLTGAWFDTMPNAQFPELFAHFFRVLKPDTHCYMFCDPETAFIAKPAGEAAGFKFWKPLVWDKRRIGMGYHYRARYEFILFFEKGKRRLADLGTADVFEVPRVIDGYPTQKPTAVTDILVRQSSDPGAVVLDPFAGSGTSGVSALRAGRRFVGWELASAGHEMATKRLYEATP